MKCGVQPYWKKKNGRRSLARWRGTPARRPDRCSCSCARGTWDDGGRRRPCARAPHPSRPPVPSLASLFALSHSPLHPPLPPTPSSLEKKNIFFAHTHTHSDFLSAQFAALKQANPGFPLLVREADGVTPVAYARYDMGVEASVPLAGLDAAGVEAAVGGLVAKGPRGA